MMDVQRKAQQEAAALQQYTNTRTAADAQTGQQVWQALAQDHAPEQWAVLIAARQALDEAGAELQEMQHQLKAAELGDDEQAEALAIVRLRRAERRYGDAQQAAQGAEQTLAAAVVHIRDSLLAKCLREYNAQLCADQAAYQQALQKLEQWAKERSAAHAEFEAQHITPLVAAGAALPRRLASNNLFAIDD